MADGHYSTASGRIAQAIFVVLGILGCLAVVVGFGGWIKLMSEGDPTDEASVGLVFAVFGMILDWKQIVCSQTGGVSETLCI